MILSDCLQVLRTDVPSDIELVKLCSSSKIKLLQDLRPLIKPPDLHFIAAFVVFASINLKSSVNQCQQITQRKYQLSKNFLLWTNLFVSKGLFRFGKLGSLKCVYRLVDKVHRSLLCKRLLWSASQCMA